MPWQPGQSGNPGGRPKENAEIKALAREHGQDAIAKLVELLDSSNPSVARAAAVDLLDRGYGKPSQTLDVDARVELSRLVIKE